VSLKPPPIRTCTGCGKRREKTSMVRVIRSPSGTLVPDLKGSLPSRGVYVCPEGSCIRKAMKGRLSASLKVQGQVQESAEDLQRDIAAAYLRRALSLLGQARKSGRVSSGTNLVEGELRRGAESTWLGLVAEDASPDIGDKIKKALSKASVPFRESFSRDDLGNAVGKSPRSVVLVRDEGIARAIRMSLDHGKNVMSQGGSNR